MNNRPNTSIQMIADYDGDVSTLFETNIEGELPVLATRNLMLFPGVLTPILIGRKESLNLINKLAEKDNQHFAIFCQIDANEEKPKQSNLYKYGVYAKLGRVLDMPGP